MGRHIPMEEIPSHFPSFVLNYTSLSLSFHVAWMAILIASIGGLCGGRSEKNQDFKGENEAANKVKDSTNLPELPPSQTNAITVMSTTPVENVERPLPLPPAVVALKIGGDHSSADKKIKPPHIDRSSTLQNYMSKSASRRRLSGSISMQIPGAKSMRCRIEDPQKNKHEDSIWTKKILLGEKCKLPLDGDDELDTEGDITEKKMSKFVEQSANSEE